MLQVSDQQKHLIVGSSEILLLKNALWILVILQSVVAVLTPLRAQHRCGTVEYMQTLRNSGLLIESENQFEEWMRDELSKQTRHSPEARRKAEVYKIPVVVHVIHNGEPVGTGTNISVAQINSQFDVLNKDFNRQNADAVNTPFEFLEVASGMSVEFVLAQIDPDGAPTNGIVRVQGTKSEWTLADNVELKSLSYWPAENYLNIWVCNIVDYFGFTQLPVSSLPGLEGSSRNRLTDGIIIACNVFGSSDYGSFDLHPVYNKGRTTTHEMGHFFGLRHIWGDTEGCGGTDYVEDTPPQSDPTFDCPVHPILDCPDENPQSKMFQNYLDFTDDVCMNLFTSGQVDRMTVVLENSPRRASLLLPLAAEQPVVQFPRVFSPNGDGINDYWLWTNTLDYQGCKLTIFNRFGKVVYEMVSYDGTWSGRTSDGYQLEEEAYYYVIRCDGMKEITGGVRIVR